MKWGVGGLRNALVLEEAARGTMDLFLPASSTARLSPIGREAGCLCVGCPHADVWEGGSVPLHFTNRRQRERGGANGEHGALVAALFLCFFRPSSSAFFSPMSAPGGLRSCTSTEFSPHLFINSTLSPQAGPGAHCDLTLLTCLLVGSYRFCIAPLLAAFNGKARTQLWRCKFGGGGD